MNRVYNYSAGPSMLPLPVLEQAASEMCDFGGTGMSVMEMSHRSKAYDAIIREAFDTFRRVMNVPDNYKILFLQGGASTQFAAVPLNLMKTGKADYVVSGEFSGKAFKEAKKYGDAKCIASSEDTNFDRIPKFSKEDVRPDASYVHICYNNTIFGTHFAEIPDTGDVPLVCDMSSCIMSEPIDISKFGMIYAGAQKNIGPAGLTVVIIREDLIGNARPDTPALLDYKVMADADSMYNTPPCYAIYVPGLVFKWVEELGGVKKMQEINEKKAALLYKAIEETKLFHLHADKDSRSLMNVTFRTGDADLDKKFVAAAAARGMVSLAGHRKVGGMRASIYNAMPVAGVEKLAAFIKEFDAADGNV
ncbi:MAG: 3-phosphoserine/phosphohydroxythreonine transaminase [Clostridia bacterium]|nr:3-phosphoserine/phosphohydroxythreonine transaminase [Clostridia bacterium]